MAHGFEGNQGARKHSRGAEKAKREKCGTRLKLKASVKAEDETSGRAGDLRARECQAW